VIDGSHLARDPLRVLVVHRNALVAQVLARRLAREHFVHEVLASTDLGRSVRQGGPWDVVVLDVSAQAPDTTPLLEHVFTLRGPPLVLVLGQEGADPIPALAAGAQGWVPLNLSLDVLVEAVRVVSAGAIWLPADLYPRVVEQVVRTSGSRTRLSVLTERQLQVLQALVNGQSTQETAEALFMSPNTVRTHRARLFVKLSVHHSLAAVVLGRQAGMTPWHPQPIDGSREAGAT
jgi:DNA-binding NarL/FixJ family response regulator